MLATQRPLPTLTRAFPPRSPVQPIRRIRRLPQHVRETLTGNVLGDPGPALQDNLDLVVNFRLKFLPAIHIIGEYLASARPQPVARFVGYKSTTRSDALAQTAY